MKNKSETKVRKHISFESGFLQKYATALLSVCNTLQRTKPDYILALSRKGPRLLELLRFLGLWLEDIPTISEKAVDFIPPEQFKGKKIAVFDDIIISGTTIKNLLEKLSRKYDAEIVLVCVAIDEETIALDKDDSGKYCVVLPNGEKVVLDYKLTLKRDERFVYCNELVRSFTLLNKSYDTDYPIFYTAVSPETMSSLLTQSTPDKAYNLTTLHQKRHGYRRFTLLPSPSSISSNLSDKIFHNSHVRIKICKTRVYSNEKTGVTTFVPMVTFEIESHLLGKGRIFSSRFSYYDKLIKQAENHMDPQESKKAIFRLVWFIVCYLYGIAFNQRALPHDNPVLHSTPSQLMDYRDLCYLFGPSLTGIILDSLDSFYLQTLRELKKIGLEKPVISSKADEISTSPDLSRSSFDNRRKEMYSSIKSYLEKNLRAEDALTNQIARISEGLYYSKEFPTEEAVRAFGIKGKEYKRLDTGFNYDQLKEILFRHKVISNPIDKVDIRISLAIDFLVDAGIQIPIFYYEREDGYFERAYRYGEDALSARRYGYLIASAMSRIFDYMKTQHKRKTLPKIAFEKIGTIFQEEIGLSGLIDVLAGPIDSDDRGLRISPEYSRYGKILHITDEACERSKWYPYMFTEWCKEEGIVRYAKGGVSHSSVFLEGMKTESKYSPRLVSDDKIAIFESLGILLFHVDHAVDTKGESEYLIALTACGDYESYLRALRTELQLFFKSSSYSFSQIIEKANEYLKNKKSESTLRETLKLLLQKPYSIANEIRHKRKLRDNLGGMIGEIEEYFGKSFTELRLLYMRDLWHHIKVIKASYDLPVEPSLVRFKEKTEDLGELCVHLSSIMKSLLELTTNMHGMRMTRGGFHKKDLRRMSTTLVNLHESVRMWNEFVATKGTAYWSAYKLNRISDASDFTRVNYTIRECNQLMAKIVPEIHEAFYRLEKVYNTEYSLFVWDGKMGHFFYKSEERARAELIGIRQAIDAARKCKSEDENLHPKVGAAIIKNNQVICNAYRGEIEPGDHAEYTALIKKSKSVDLAGATLITTLEPCTTRNHDKKPCALHIADRGIKKVVVGMIDPNPEIRGKGILFLEEKGIAVALFPHTYGQEVRTMNQDFFEKEMDKYKIDLMKNPMSKST